MYFTRHHGCECKYDGPDKGGDTLIPDPETGDISNPPNPPKDSTIATEMIAKCGRWHAVEEEDSHIKICLNRSINIALFLATNLSLGTSCEKCIFSLL